VRNPLTILAFALGIASPAFAGGPVPTGVEAHPADDTGPRRHVPLDLFIDKSKVDLHEHHLELKASRDLAKVSIKVVGDSGATLADETHDLGPQPAGTPLVVRWSQTSDEPIVQIEVFVFDTDGYYKGIAITPWSVSIPHEEVNFRHDSSQIDDSEKSKLEASYAKVAEAIGKHREIKATLFLAGHTDTVGDPSYNLRLSRQRALAIGRWFRQRGLTIPIAYEGFGESALLVKTADEVDEPRNRRCDYILSVDEPVFKSSGYHPNWMRLP